MHKFAFIAIFCLISAAWAYSGGAPEATCEDMTPKHPVDPQSSESPYTVKVNKQQIKGGEDVELTVTGKPFKGFLLQVRKGNTAVGTFNIPDNHKFAKTLNCFKNPKSAATHKNSEVKSDLKLTWTSPKTPGDYVVYLTAAQDGGVFWVRKPTATIKVL